MSDLDVSRSGNPIPRVRGDQTLPLLFHGYGYFGRRIGKLAAVGFEGRFLGRRTLFLSGRQGARLFYDDRRLQRADAVPGIVQHSLFGKHTVQALDGTAHRERKAMFAPLTDPRHVDRLVSLVADEWQRAAGAWVRGGHIRLFDEAVRILGRAALRWNDLPPSSPGSERRIDDMRAIVDHFGSPGLGQLWGRLARLRVNAWAAQYVIGVRDGRREAASDSMLALIAAHRDGDGRLLDVRTATEELLNVLRPVLANAWWITYAAHALHFNPQWRSRLVHADSQTARMFTDEVRRFYPFVPMLSARARHGFTWMDHYIPQGRRVLLDIYGTNHEPGSWSYPDSFDPERFVGGERDPFAFVPQGGGDTWHGHRCPGEDITSAIMDWTVRDLAQREYHIANQDLRVNYRRFPAHVRSGVVLSNVRGLAKPRQQV